MNAVVKPQPCPTDRARLRLLSYNIQTAVAATRPHHYVTRGWKHLLPHSESFGNLDRIAHLVQDFDVVALQEVDAGSLRSSFVNQTEYLARQGRFPFWYYQTNRNLGKFAQHSNGLLSRVRPSEVTEHKLPGIIPGRGAMMVRYGHGDDPLVLLLVHLALGRQARWQQVQFISAIVNQYRHVVVMGDFNCELDSPEMTLLLRKTDLCEPLETLHTFPSWRPCRNIDHILVSPTLEVHAGQVLHHVYSDHLPIALEISVPHEVKLWSGSALEKHAV